MGHFYMSSKEKKIYYTEYSILFLSSMSSASGSKKKGKSIFFSCIYTSKRKGYFRVVPFF